MMDCFSERILRKLSKSMAGTGRDENLFLYDWIILVSIRMNSIYYFLFFFDFSLFI